MADNGLSFDSFIPSSPEAQDSGLSFEAAAGLNQPQTDQDLQNLEGYTPKNTPSFEAAAGIEAPQGEDFSQYDINQRYKSLPKKAMDLLSYPERKLAEQAIKFAPEIKDAATNIASSLGVDTSNWSPVDQEKWKLYLKAPEVHFHDLTNLLIDHDSAKSRFLVGLAADVLLDPTLYVGNILGATAKGVQAEKVLQEGQQLAKLSDRLRSGEAAVARIGLGKLGFDTPGVVNKGAAAALDIAEQAGVKALDVADNMTNGQTRRALYNFLTQTNDPEVGNRIMEYSYKNMADSVNIGSLNDKLRPAVEALGPAEKEALIKYLEKPYDVIAAGGEDALKSDIRFNKFPLSSGYREVADTIRKELSDRNFELADYVGKLDKSGRPTIGWTAIDEALPKEEIMTRPSSYFPRQIHPEYKKFLSENGITEPNIPNANPLYSDTSRRERQYRDVVTSEASRLEREQINSILKDKGLEQYTGKIFEDDPLNAVVRYNAMAKQQLNRMKLEDALVERSISAEDWQKLTPSERLKWQRFDAGSDVVASGNPYVTGKKLHDRFLRQGDADRAKMALNLAPMTTFDKAVYGVSFASRFFRQAALLSPRYFTGNFIGNIMNSVTVAPNRAQLFNDWGKAFGIIRSFANRSDKVYDVAGELMTADKFVEEASRLGLWDANRMREFYDNLKDVGTTVSDTIQASRNLYSQTGKLPPAWNVFKFNQEFTNLYADNLSKLGLYLNFRNAGYSKAGAARAVEEALFNFNNVSPVLAQTRRVAPFITYPIKMIPFTAKTVAKYPWLPSLVDNTVSNAVSQNMDLTPMEGQVVKDLSPLYYRSVFNPLIANILPGNNLVISDLQSPMSTINNIMNIRAPGVTPVALLALGVNPETLSRIQETDFSQNMNDDGPSMLGAIGKSLVTDPMPKPIKFLLSQVPGASNLVDNPYYSKVHDRVSKYRMLTDNADESLGKYLTTQTFMRKFMPDAFEEMIVKNDPEFFRTVGSVARQHLKDVFFGLANVTPLDGEMLIRRLAIQKELANQKKKLGGLSLDAARSQDPNYRADDRKKIMEDITTLQKSMQNLGMQYQMIDNLQRRYGTVIKEDFNPDGPK